MEHQWEGLIANSEVAKLRAENERLRGEVQAMQEAVDKFWSEFSARTILLLASLNKTDEGEEGESE